jgi:hypothetical protein
MKRYETPKALATMMSRPGLARCGPPGDIIARRRPSFAAQSNFPHKLNVKFLGGPPGWCPPRPYGQSGPDDVQN